MRKIYYLSTCSTCKRIMDALALAEFQLQDVKTEPLQSEQLEFLKNLAGSYEALFSRKAMKYRLLGLHQMDLLERDYKKWILKEYTFLKRPVVVVGDKIFVGSAKKVVQQLLDAAQSR